MTFRFPRARVAAWSPLDHSPTAFYLAPNYDDSAAAGLWTKSAGEDVAASGDYPVADSGAPVFDPGVTTTALVNAEESSSWYGADEHHVVAVVDLAGVTAAGADQQSTASIWCDENSTSGMVVYRTGAGPYQYFVDYFEYDGAFKVATVEVSLGRVVIQGKKDDTGKLWIKSGTGAWVGGDTAALPFGYPTAALRIGSNYNGTAILDGTIRALGFFDAAQSDAAFANKIPAWAATIPFGWTRSSTAEMPTSPDEWFWRDGCQMVQLASGRILSLGGWNSDDPFGSGDRITNEVWASDDDGETWELILEHDPSPPTSGAGARFMPGHGIGITTYNGVAVVMGADPNVSASPDVWHSNSDGTVWTRVSTTAPCGDRWLFMLGKIGETIYMMGGQTDVLDSASAVKEVFRSTDGGVNWTQLSDATWPAGRGMVYRPVTVGGKIVIVGGGAYGTSPLAYNGVYSFDGSTWTEVLADEHGQFEPGYWQAVAYANGRIWQFNGYNDTNGNLSRATYSEDGGYTWAEFAGGSGGPVSHADQVVGLASGRVVRMSGGPNQKTVHVFDKF